MRKIIILYVIIFVCVIHHASVNAQVDILSTFDNIVNFEKQNVISGKIDSLNITKGPFQYELEKGKVEFFNFGLDKPIIMYYEGKGKFKYEPPNAIEHQQLKRLAKKDTLEMKFKALTVIFTDNTIDSDIAFELKEKKPSKEAKKALSGCFEVSRRYLLWDISSRVIRDLTNDYPGDFFYVDFLTFDDKHIIVNEDPLNFDMYSLYSYKKEFGRIKSDILCSYSPEISTIFERPTNHIDIFNYEINVEINVENDEESDEKNEIDASCRIHFFPRYRDTKYIYLLCSPLNKIYSATDANGNEIQIIQKEKEYGFGLLLNDYLEIDKEYYLDIDYACKSFTGIWDSYFIEDLAIWYPRNCFRDDATYDLTYRYPSDLTLVSSGELVDTTMGNETKIARWRVDPAVQTVSFDIGPFNGVKYYADNLPTVEVYITMNEAGKTGLDATGEDIGRSYKYFSLVFGEVPFKQIKVVETPFFHSQGTPGLIHLSWFYRFMSDYGKEKSEYIAKQDRAHEISHLWWGHTVKLNNQRDIWISEGLAEYSGLLYFMAYYQDMDATNKTLKRWQRIIDDGESHYSDGSEAGSLVLGHRLFSSKSNDYLTLIYTKGAYIFHMIRYLLYDYDNNSDEKFIAFLQDIVHSFKDIPITTESLELLVSKHIQSDMSWFFDQYVYGVDIPTYECSFETEKISEGKYEVTCKIEQSDVPDNFKMIMPITVKFEGDQYAHFRHWVTGSVTEFKLPLLPLEPKDIDFNTFDAVLARVRE